MSGNDFQAKLAQATGKNTEGEKKTAVKAATRRKKKEKPRTSIENNPFAQIVATTPDPKLQKEKMVELMTYTDPETNAANNKALSEYSAYMQEERQRLAVELIEMTDTKTFSNMQKVLVDINNGVLDFEEQIKPFMEIIEAVRQIQAEDATTDILSEMREDKKAAEALEAKIGGIDSNINKITQAIKDARVAIEKHSEDRGWFGFGDVKQSAKDSIANLKADIVQLEEDRAKAEKEKTALRSQVTQSESKYENLREAKEILAKMLALSEGDHEARHEQLVKTASDFVLTTKERVTGTLEHSLQMGEQISNLSDLAFTMRSRYSVLSEASKDAEAVNSKRHAELLEEIENNTDSLSRIEQEDMSRSMAKHITTLNDSARDTTNVIADLTVSSQRIETMEAANIAQIKKTEQIQTSGIAGVADNLSSVLTAINQAAIGQASTAAQQSLRRMNTSTVELTKEQMLNAAKAQNDDNSALINALEQLSGFGEVIEIANQSAQEAVEENRDLLDQMRDSADEVQRAATDTLEITSKVIAEEQD